MATTKNSASAKVRSFANVKGTPGHDLWREKNKQAWDRRRQNREVLPGQTQLDFTAQDLTKLTRPELNEIAKQRSVRFVGVSTEHLRIALAMVGV